MREGNGLGGWDLTRQLVTAAVLSTMALLVVGTGLARLSEDLGDEVVVETAGAALSSTDDDPPTDIGTAAVEIAGEPVPTSTDHLTIVRVAATTCGERRVGSGVVIDDGLVLTAAHVVGDQGVVRVDAGGAVVVGEVLGVAVDGRDLALVAVDAPMDGPVALGRVDRIGEPITVVGYPAGGPRTAAVGPSIDLDPAVASRVVGDVIGASIAIDEGMSGGPALDGAGALLGIVVAAETISGTALVVEVDDLDGLMPGHLVPGDCPATA